MPPTGIWRQTAQRILLSALRRTIGCSGKSGLSLLQTDIPKLFPRYGEACLTCEDRHDVSLSVLVLSSVPVLSGRMWQTPADPHPPRERFRPRSSSAG